MITIERFQSLFSDTTKYAYKDGILFAVNYGERWEIFTESAPVALTRAKGFRYWEKYFPNRPDYLLPPLLEEATNMPPMHEGVFTRKDGTLCGYCG